MWQGRIAELCIWLHKDMISSMSLTCSACMIDAKALVSSWLTMMTTLCIGLRDRKQTILASWELAACSCTSNAGLAAARHITQLAVVHSFGLVCIAGLMLQPSMMGTCRWHVTCGKAPRHHSLQGQGQVTAEYYQPCCSFVPKEAIAASAAPSSKYTTASWSRFATAVLIVAHCLNMSTVLIIGVFASSRNDVLQ